MFSYDQNLLAAARSNPDSIPDVIHALETMQDVMEDSDGLKWFNWLYLGVTRAVQARIAQGGLEDPAWLDRLDAQFARLYLRALESYLVGPSAGAVAGSWRALFDRRQDASLARIQFALAGINAHINYDLPTALVHTCELSGIGPEHGGPQYRDYTQLNGTLASVISGARDALHVRLLGDSLPAVSHVENTAAAWNVFAAREAAWVNAEVLWAVRDASRLWVRQMDMLDGITTVAGKALLVAAPAPVHTAATESA
jgi:hypothetical protein